MIFVELTPSAQLNEGEDGASRSVIVQLFQLTHAESMEQTHYEDLWEANPKAVLGDSLLAGPDEAPLVPGLRLKLRLTRHPEAQFLAVTGKFRRSDGRWRAVTPLPPAVDPCSRKAKSPENVVRGSALHSDLAFELRRAP